MTLDVCGKQQNFWRRCFELEHVRTTCKGTSYFSLVLNIKWESVVESLGVILFHGSSWCMERPVLVWVSSSSFFLPWSIYAVFEWQQKLFGHMTRKSLFGTLGQQFETSISKIDRNQSIESPNKPDRRLQNGKYQLSWKEINRTIDRSFICFASDATAQFIHVFRYLSEQPSSLEMNGENVSTFQCMMRKKDRSD